MKVLQKPIPEALKRLDRWCLFRLEAKATGTKPTKRPITTGGAAASCTDAATWTTFDAALAALNRPELEADGLNLATGGDGDPVLAAFDLDNAVSDDGTVDPRVEHIVAEVGSYAEFSPSGSGVRIWCFAPAGTESISRPRDGFEFAAGRHFFSVTGNSLLPGARSVVATIDLATPRRLYQQFVSPPEPKEASPQAAERHETQPEQPERPKSQDAGESHHDGDGESAVAAAIRRCLEALADWRADDRGAWVEILCVLRNAAAEHGLELRDAWHEFSRRSDKYSAEDADRVWDQFEVRGENDRRLGIGSLLRWASEDSGIPVEQLAGTFEVKSGPKPEVAASDSSKPFAYLTPVPSSQLQPEQLDAQWIWRGYLARGYTTILSSLWKAGKTTLIANVLRELGGGGALAGDIMPAKALVMSEESQGLWVRRRDRWNIGDHVHFLCRPLREKMRPVAWVPFIDRILELSELHGYSLVVCDTWSYFSAITNENDAAEVQAAIMPLQRLTEARLSVLLMAHSPKVDQNQGRGIRGSGALAGFADILLEIKRFDPGNPHCCKRRVGALSRFEETPAEVVLELGEHEFRVVPDTQSEALRWDILRQVLTGKSDGMQISEIRGCWPGTPPGERQLRELLDRHARQNQLRRWQSTGRGQPFLWALPETSTEVL